MKKGDFVRHIDGRWYVATKVGRIHDYVKLHNGEKCSQSEITESCKRVDQVCGSVMQNSNFCVVKRGFGTVGIWQTYCHAPAYNHLVSGGECYTHIKASLDDEKVVRYYEWLIHESPVSFLFCKKYDWKRRQSVKIVYKKGQSKAALRIACMLTRLPWDSYLDGHWDIYNYLIDNNIQPWLALMSLNMIMYFYGEKIKISTTEHKPHLPFPHLRGQTIKFLYLLGQEKNIKKYFKDYNDKETCYKFLGDILMKEQISSGYMIILDDPTRLRTCIKKPSWFLNFLKNIQKEF